MTIKNILFITIYLISSVAISSDRSNDYYSDKSSSPNGKTVVSWKCKNRETYGCAIKIKNNNSKPITVWEDIREPDVNWSGDNLVEIRSGCGTSCVTSIFYSPQHGLSDKISSVVAVAAIKMKIATANGSLKIIDIFNKNIIALTIELDFTPRAVFEENILNVEFLSKNRLFIRYLSGEEMIEKTKIVALDGVSNSDINSIEIKRVYNNGDVSDWDNWIIFNDKIIEKTEHLYAGIKLEHRTQDGVIYIISENAGGSGSSTVYHIIDILSNGNVKISEKFSYSDGTFEVKQKSNNKLVIDLGYENGLRKYAIYANHKLEIKREKVKKSRASEDDCNGLYNNTYIEFVNVGKCDEEPYRIGGRAGLSIIEAMGHDPRLNLESLSEMMISACKSKEVISYSEFREIICNTTN